MKTFRWAAALVCALVLAPICRAGDEPAPTPAPSAAPTDAPKKGPGARGFNVLTVEKISEKLGADAALTDDQKTKVTEAREALKKRYEELHAKPEVQAAEKELQDAKDKDARDAAMKKLKDLGQFNQRDEYKKALDPILNDAQKAKLPEIFAAGNRKKPEGGGKPEAKPSEAPKDAPKTEGKTETPPAPPEGGEMK